MTTIIPPDLFADVKTWTVEHVKRFVEANRDQYQLDDDDLQFFVEEKINGRALLQLHVKQLRELGLRFGPANSIADLVNALKKDKGLVETGVGVKRPLPIDVTQAVVDRWSKKQILDLPPLSELHELLDRPLSEQEKIPLIPELFNGLITRGVALQDLSSQTDVERLFRVSETEASHTLFLVFYNAVIQPPPPENGTESSYHHFWDLNFRCILEFLVPAGKSIRDSCQDTFTINQRPDYGFILRNICAFRGEEKGPSTGGNPRAELADKLTWTYSPAPYVFAYYANAADVVLAAICAPKPPSESPLVQDLARANLRLKRERIANLVRLINLVPYIERLLSVIGDRECPEYDIFERNGKAVELLSGVVKKTYLGKNASQWAEYVRNIYRQLKMKSVPFVDALCHFNPPSIFVKPRGISVKPHNEKELLDAITCILKALVVLHQPPPLFHRDIRWPNILRNPFNADEWFLTDWDDAVGATNIAAKSFSKKDHCPSVFEDNHGGEVDVWGVGNLIILAPGFGLSISHNLYILGERMKSGMLSVQDALKAVEDY